MHHVRERFLMLDAPGGDRFVLWTVETTLIVGSETVFPVRLEEPAWQFTGEGFRHATRPGGGWTWLLDEIGDLSVTERFGVSQGGPDALAFDAGPDALVPIGGTAFHRTRLPELLDAVDERYSGDIDSLIYAVEESMPDVLAPAERA